jgi:hypothetical protein
MAKRPHRRSLIGRWQPRADHAPNRPGVLTRAAHAYDIGQTLQWRGADRLPIIGCNDPANAQQVQRLTMAYGHGRAQAFALQVDDFVGGHADERDANGPLALARADVGADQCNQGHTEAEDADRGQRPLRPPR